MMAEVAGGGEVGRLAVLVAAIAGDGLGAGEAAFQQCFVLVVERDFEHLEIVGAVLALAEARPDDAGGDGRMIEHPTGRDV